MRDTAQLQALVTAVQTWKPMDFWAIHRVAVPLASATGRATLQLSSYLMRLESWLLLC